MRWQKVSHEDKKNEKVQICQNAPRPLSHMILILRYWPNRDKNLNFSFLHPKPLAYLVTLILQFQIILMIITIMGFFPHGIFQECLKFQILEPSSIPTMEMCPQTDKII
jgi:hypothetical protein